MPTLPSGTVTFLFTDIEGSTPLWESHPKAMKAALVQHDAILNSAIAEHSGQVFKLIGDAFEAAFVIPAQAVEAAIAAQRALAGERWDPRTGPIKVRMGIHTGPAEVHGSEYSGHTLNRVARIMAAGHGGQILLSHPAADLARGDLPKDVRYKDLGQHYLKGLSQPEHLFQILVPDLPADFPPLVTRIVPRGYQLLEQIGEGGFGAVYRAFHPDVGREVAIKIIRPEFANAPEFIRRFEAEAQIIARLEHPRIVPLYDYWREPDSAFLVMRLLRGGSLEKLLQRGPLSLEQAGELLEQMADALSAAHSLGIVHRDLKPANILLDESGNFYLSDFGIAKQTALEGQLTRSGAFLGSPQYMSPEQMLSQPVSPQADLYSLGLLMYEALVGERPFADDSVARLIDRQLHELLPSAVEKRSDLPAAVDEVIRRATAKDPSERYPDVLAFAAAFRTALSGSPLPAGALLPKAGPAALLNPYKGLRAFQEADAADFFGREALVERLLARLSPTGDAFSTDGKGPESGRFLAVVGPSGSGKSSAVRAGLVPAIRRGHLPSSSQWFISDMLPGPHPLEELEAALLRVAVNPPASLLEQLRADQRGLARAIKRILPGDESTELILIIDQFEEVFTLVEDPAEARLFLDSLYAAVSDPRSRLRLVLTLRADFYDRPLMFPDFSQLVQHHTEAIVPLTVAELARAISAPAERVGAALEEGLAAVMAVEVSEQPGGLPLLQYALTELFERREGRVLTQAAYKEIGGVAGALGRRAEEIYLSLAPDLQAAARQAFLRLVTLGEGVEDTRRRTLRAELEALELEQSAVSNHPSPVASLRSPGSGLAPGISGSTPMAQAIEAFGKSRLLSFDRDPLTRGPTVEVAHEALLREWQRLRGWLEASREDLRSQRRLGSLTQEWLAAGREASFLLRGARLDLFERWSAQTDLALTADERAYLQASLAERQARRAAEAERQAHEARLERRSRAFLRGLVGVFALATVVAVLLSVFAFNQQRLAQKQTSLAVSRELAVQAINSLEADPELSILLALQALRTSYTREAEDALHQAVQASRVRVSLPIAGGARTVEFSSDGKTIAMASYENVVTIWETGSWRELHTMTGIVARYSLDGRLLATGGEDGEVAIWDVATGAMVRSFEGHSKWVNDVLFSPDGRLLISASKDDTFIVWDVESGEKVFSGSSVTSGFNAVDYVGFNANGSLIVSTDFYNDEKIDTLVWGVDQGGQLLNKFSGHSVLVFSPDGRWRVALGGEELNEILLWDLSKLSSTGLASYSFPIEDAIRFPEAHEGLIGDFTFSPDGSLLATASIDDTAKLWRLSTDGVEPLMTLSGHGTIVDGVSLSPDGRYLASASLDGIRIWDITPSGASEWFAIDAHEASVRRFGLTADWKYLATASADGIAKVWDLASGEQLLAVTEHGAPLFGVALSPDGKLLATAGEDNIANLWKLDFSSGEPNAELLHTLIDHGDAPPVGGMFPGLTAVVFSPDGAKVATGGQDGIARIWDTKTGEQLQAIKARPEGFGITRLAFSPDGSFLVTTSDVIPGGSVAKVWDVQTGKEITISQGYTDGARIWALAISPDGERVATGSLEDKLYIWDAKTGEVKLEISTSGLGADFSPDGKYLASTSIDGTLRVWDAASREELRMYTNPDGPFFDVAFSPDGTRLIASGIGKVYGYILNLDELIQVANTRVTRWFRPEECRLYLHVEECPPAP